MCHEHHGEPCDHLVETAGDRGDARQALPGGARVADEHDGSGVLLALHLPGGLRRARGKLGPRFPSASGTRHMLAGGARDDGDAHALDMLHLPVY